MALYSRRRLIKERTTWKETKALCRNVGEALGRRGEGRSEKKEECTRLSCQAGKGETQQHLCQGLTGRRAVYLGSAGPPRSTRVGGPG